MTLKLFRSLTVAAVLTTPFASFAQSNAPMARESVPQELIELQRAGCTPASDEARYASNIEAAEARLHAQDRAAANAYGPTAADTSGAGAPNAVKSVLGLDSAYSRS